jgi:hypothetical protein
MTYFFTSSSDTTEIQVLINKMHLNSAELNIS